VPRRRNRQALSAVKITLKRHWTAGIRPRYLSVLIAPPALALLAVGLHGDWIEPVVNR
jgi:hypothetical protein